MSAWVSSPLQQVVKTGKTVIPSSWWLELLLSKTWFSEENLAFWRHSMSLNSLKFHFMTLWRIWWAGSFCRLATNVDNALSGFVSLQWHFVNRLGTQRRDLAIKSVHNVATTLECMAVGYRRGKGIVIGAFTPKHSGQPAQATHFHQFRAIRQNFARFFPYSRACKLHNRECNNVTGSLRQ